MVMKKQNRGKQANENIANWSQAKSNTRQDRRKQEGKRDKAEESKEMKE